LQLQLAGRQDRGGAWRILRWETWLSQIDKKGGFYSLEVTHQQCRTDFVAPKCARDSFNIVTSVDSGLLFDSMPGVRRREKQDLAHVSKVGLGGFLLGCLESSCGMFEQAVLQVFETSNRVLLDSFGGSSHN